MAMLKRLKWDVLSKRRKTARLVAMFKAHRGDKAWMDIRDRFEASKFKGRNDHCYKEKCSKADKEWKLIGGQRNC